MVIQQNKLFFAQSGNTALNSVIDHNSSKIDIPLVAIAPNIKDYHFLATGIQTGANIIILDENQDAIEQLTAAIADYSATSLHIICHGAPGILKLGKTPLSSDNIKKYRYLLAEWNVDNIHLWSCNVAAEQTEFLKTLHQFTGANIAASSNIVGNYETYSNWQLDYHVGINSVTEPPIFTDAVIAGYSGLFTDPGSNYSTAQNIGVLGSTQTFSDAVGTTDREDWYRFTLNEISEVNLNLTGLEEPAQVSILTDLDNDGILGNDPEIIKYDDIRDTSSSIADRGLTQTLPPGTYAIRVYTYYDNQNTAYTLSASATTSPPTTETDPGENLNSALNIDPLSTTPQTFTDAVGSVDRNDYYEFTLDEISEVSFNLTGLTEPAHLVIATDLDNDAQLDSNEFIEYDDIRDTSSSTADRGISKILSPGTYVAGVYTYYNNQNTGYTFSASAIPQPPTNVTDPGEDFDSALNLGRLGGTQTFTDAVGSLDRNDYYQFTLDQNATLAFNLTGLTEPAQLVIATDLNNDGQLNSNEFIEYDDIRDTSSSTADRGISTTLSPGTYAVGVYTYYNNQNTGYTLTTIAPGTPEPPDDEIEYNSQQFTVNGVYEPIPGDFNGDDNGDILWYRPGTGADFIWSFDDDNSYEGERFTVNGNYTPVTGDFDGSGTTDILWYRPGLGADYIWSFNEDGSYEGKRFTVNGNYTPVTGDFDGSGTTDILWYRPGPGADYIWSFNEDGSYEGERFTVNGNYTPVTGDFDGSGTTDILWYRPGPGADYIWSFNEDGTYEGEALSVNGVYEPVEGDFNGDEIDDILWYSPGPGADFIWAFQPGGEYESTELSVDGVYKPVVEDFDSNGYSDILWYTPGTGSDFLWSFV